MALIFNIKGPIAMFRKSYTTTSSVSFPFPPPTAVAGLLGAIAGYGSGAEIDACRADFWRRMKGTRIGLAILEKGIVSSHTINFSNTKDPKKNPRIQVKHQFVFSPKYRVYVSGEIEKDLNDHLKNGTFIFTPYLGVAYALAEIEFIGNCEEKDHDTEYPIPVDSVIPWSHGVSVDILKSGGVFKERMPFEMDEVRGLKQALDVLYAPSPDRRLVLLDKGNTHVTRCAEDVVAWFPEW
ncbi:MAG: type I-B CRISPR-associated protein Cas5b [Aminivibrio sp.]|jgi:CRISPR-associated protein Cas5h